MMPKLLKQRSSWPSSFITGLIGWNGLTVIVALASGYSGSFMTLFQIATLNAVFQVIVLRLFFFILRMGKNIWWGVLWGTVTAGLLVVGERNFVDIIQKYFLVSLLTGLYIGGPVGAFLSYFYRDDQRIEEAAKKERKPVDYGRDAHWLDPFLYGAAAYGIVFLPRTFDLALCAVVVGSFIGVVAAGVSHFFLSLWGNKVWTIPVAGIAGAALGAVSGLLFRNFASELFLPYLAVGALAGFFTFLITATMGRVFSQRENRGWMELS